MKSVDQAARLEWEAPADWSGAWLALPLLLTLAAAAAWPFVELAREALDAGGFSAFALVLGPGRYRVSLENSLLLSTAAAAGAVVLAVWPAWLLARERFWGRAFIRAALSLPLSFSGIIFGFLMIVLLGRIGLVPLLMRLLFGRPLFAASAYTLAGLYVAYLYFEVPRAVMTLESAFRRFPEELDWAARTLGAGPWMRFSKIFLPTIAPALRSAFAVTFSTSMGSFGVALLLARRFTVAPLEIYTQITGFYNDAAAGALCVVLAAVTLFVEKALFHE